MAEQLEQRFKIFALSVKQWCKALHPDVIDRVYMLQLIRSSSSIGANYIEACEPLGKADQLHRMRIARKEAKESKYWLELLHGADADKERIILISEADQIKRILSSIIQKLER